MKTEDKNIIIQHNIQRIISKTKNREKTEKKKKKREEENHSKLYLIFSFIIYFFSSVHHLYSCKILADQISLVHSTNCYLAFDLFITIFRKVHVEFILKLFYLVGNTILYFIP